MKAILDSKIVLVVNRNWQVINVTTVQGALAMMIADAATGFDVDGDNNFIPTKWEDWHKLPVRESDDHISTPRQQVRVPRVIMAVNYAGVTRQEKKCTPENLLAHYDYTCALTGKKLNKKNFSREHVVPKSKWKGNKRDRDGWKNIVPACKDINSKRGNRSYKEAGLPEPKIKPAPKPKVFAETVVNHHGFPEWDFFLGKTAKAGVN